MPHYYTFTNAITEQTSRNSDYIQAEFMIRALMTLLETYRFVFFNIGIWWPAYVNQKHINQAVYTSRRLGWVLFWNLLIISFCILKNQFLEAISISDSNCVVSRNMGQHCIKRNSLQWSTAKKYSYVFFFPFFSFMFRRQNYTRTMYIDLDIISFFPTELSTLSLNSDFSGRYVICYGYLISCLQLGARALK